MSYGMRTAVRQIFDETVGQFRIAIRPLDEIEIFRVSVHNHHAHKINQLNVPAHQPWSTTPYLLMVGLVEPEKLMFHSTDTHRGKLAKLLSQAAVVIVGVGGRADAD